jgi:hypothetical protein
VAATDYHVDVHGYEPIMRAIRTLDKQSAKEMRAAMRKAADPIARDAGSLLARRYRGVSTSTIRPRTSARGVYVTQRQKKKTGRRADFGSLQFTRGLYPAASDGLTAMGKRVEHEIMRLASREGF